MGGPVRRVWGVGRRGVLGVVAWGVVVVRAAAEAVVCGVPRDARLRRVLRSPAAAPAREAAGDELRARLAALTAAVPSARPALTAFEDDAVRAPRFAPRIFPPPKGAPRPATALRATLYASAYFGTDAPGQDMVRALVAAGGWAPADDDAHALSGPGPARITWDRPGHPLPEPRTHAPGGATVAGIRAAHGAVVCWSSSVTYLTVPRRPPLRWAARRSGPGAAGPG